MLFTNWKRFLKYMYCILIGAPVWFVVGIIITLAPEFEKVLKVKETVSAGTAVGLFFAGAAIGNIIAAVIAQLTSSRKLTMLLFLVVNAISVLVYLNARDVTSQQFSLLCLLIGITGGYLATLVTISAEQFGTNIRATVTTSVPNFVRGTIIPINAVFSWFLIRYDMIKSSYIMIFALTVIALLALSQLRESFNNDLDYVETD